MYQIRVKHLVACYLIVQCLSKGVFGASVESKSLIQIGVEVVEVDEQKTQNLGVQWLSTLNVMESGVPSLLKVGSLTRDALTADLQFLEQHGAADLLANPKLVALDGTTAAFQVGGELPYATSSSLGSTNVEFKSYGVNLKMTPHREENGKITISLEAEVSGPDTQNSVTLSGNTVPAIRSRKFTSQLMLDPGTTLTVAGLIQTDKEWTRVGVPGLMHIPLLGYLFSHRTQTNNRTSIVVFVTPTVLEDAAGKGSAQKPGGTSFLPYKPATISPNDKEDEFDRQSLLDGLQG